MIDSFSFEAKRIFGNKKYVSVFLIVLGLALYTINLGIEKHREFELEKSNFLDFEKQKTSQYINHEQYGAYGFRVLFLPSPLSIFHSSLSHALIGSIDTKEIVNISQDLKGKNIFSGKVRTLDFAIILYVFGSLIMLFFGLNLFPGLRAMSHRGKFSWDQKTAPTLRYGDMTARLILLLGYFACLLTAAYLFPSIQGIRFSFQDTTSYVLFSLFTLSYLTLFFLLGIFIALAVKFQKSLFIIAYAFWFLVIFMVPEIDRIHIEKKAGSIQSNESVNIKKLKNVMNFERKTKEYFASLQEKKVKDIEGLARQLARNYSERMYRLNKKIETDLRNAVDGLIHVGGRKASLIPPTYFLFLSQELLNGGYHGYQKFLAYILNLKEHFFLYYIDNRYEKPSRQVEPFVKRGENIFMIRSYIPSTFFRGFLSTLFYLLLLIGLILIISKRRLLFFPKAGERQTKNQIDVDKMEIGKTYFALYENMSEREQILHFLEGQGAKIINNINNNEFDTGITLSTWLRHECRYRKLQPENIVKIMDTMGINKLHLDRRLKTLPPETLNLTYFAIIISESSRYYVLNNFISGMSRDFENKVKKILKNMKKKTIVIYIAKEMFELSLEKGKPAKDSRIFILDYENVSLR